MSGLGTRVVSGVILLASVLVAIWLRGPLFMLFIAAASLISAHELYTMARKAGYSPWYPAGLSLSLLLAVRGYLSGDPFRGDVPVVQGTGSEPLVVVLVLLLLLARQAMTWRRSVALGAAAGPQGSTSAVEPVAGSGHMRGPLMAWADMGITLGGAIYTGGLLGYAPFLAEFPGHVDGRVWMLVVLLGTAACDTGAYFVGSLLGRHKMIPHVSPGKTWEGLAGGVLGAEIAALAFMGALGIELWQALLLGLLVCAAAVSGDLCESLIKRASGVKDSGNLIPGHGGVLDRLDSILFVTLAVYWFAELASR